MKILIVKSRLPYPPDEGTHIGTFHLLCTLSREHEVTILSIVRSPREKSYSEVLKNYCHDVVILEAFRSQYFFVRGIKRIGRLLLTIFTGIPGVVLYNSPHAFKLKARQLIKNIRFDIVQVEYWHTARIIRGIRNVRRVLLHHDASYMINDSAIQVCTSFLKKMFLIISRRIEKRYLLSTCQWFDVNLTVTNLDAEILRKACSKDVRFEVKPTLIGKIDSHSQKPDSEDIDTIFIGDMSYHANEDAALYFIQSIWPIISGTLPYANFYIVGKDPSKEIMNFNGQNSIVVTGRVKNVYKYLNRAKVVIVPLRIGSGLKIKVLEAMSAGKPIVMTSIGAQGIEVVNQQDVFVIDDTVFFAEQVIKLLSNEKLRKEVGHNAKSAFQKYYDHRVCEPQILRLYMRLI